MSSSEADADDEASEESSDESGNSGDQVVVVLKNSNTINKGNCKPGQDPAKNNCKAPPKAPEGSVWPQKKT